MKENPFNITFGKEPSAIISRTEELGEIYNSFSSSNPNSSVYILTGVRGCGKTVAMTSVFEYYKKEKDWICVELNPEQDLLEQLAAKIYDEGKMHKLFFEIDFNFSFKGFGFAISGKEPITSISTLLQKEFDYLKAKHKRVLIAIDEVSPNNYMKIFAHEYQTFLRNNFDVCLLMTGLHQNISSLQNQKTLTFLYRAPKIYLSALNPVSIANSYKNIFNIPNELAIKLSSFTKGYAYAYQLLGNILFEEEKTNIDTAVVERFDEALYTRAYSIIYNELTGKEREILSASITSETNNEIIEKTNIDKTQLSVYKRNLFLKGIIQNNKNSVVLTLPRFKEFIQFIALYNGNNY